MFTAQLLNPGYHPGADPKNHHEAAPLASRLLLRLVLAAEEADPASTASRASQGLSCSAHSRALSTPGSLSLGTPVGPAARHPSTRIPSLGLFGFCVTPSGAPGHQPCIRGRDLVEKGRGAEVGAVRPAACRELEGCRVQGRTLAPWRVSACQGVCCYQQLPAPQVPETRAPCLAVVLGPASSFRPGRSTRTSRGRWQVQEDISWGQHGGLPAVWGRASSTVQTEPLPAQCWRPCPSTVVVPGCQWAHATSACWVPGGRTESAVFLHAFLTL